MKTTTSSLLLAGTALLGVATARDIPANLQSLIDSIKGQGQCNNPLASGFYALQDGSADTVYCGDHWSSNDAGSLIYLQTGADFADLDTDCDGITDDPTGQCDFANNQDAQGQTSYGSMAKDWGLSADDLTSEIHSYVVLGNVNSDNQDGYSEFNPADKGVAPMSVVAVVCNNQLHYAVWADENGSEDGPQALVGEASLALGNLCFPDDGLSYSSGHEELDVFYLAFTGDDAIPREGVDWNTQDAGAFEDSLAAIGDKLVGAIAV